MSNRKGYNISKISSNSQQSSLGPPVEIKNNDVDSIPRAIGSEIDGTTVQQHNVGRMQTKSSLNNKTNHFSKIRE